MEEQIIKILSEFHPGKRKVQKSATKRKRTEKERPIIQLILNKQE